MNESAITKLDKNKEKRQTRLNLRLSDEEYAFVKHRAEGFGLPLAVFVRIHLLDLPAPAKRQHDLPVVEPKLLRQIISIGNNINQLTRYAHSVANDPKQTLDVLQLALVLQNYLDELKALREQYSLKETKNSALNLIEAPTPSNKDNSPILIAYQDENN